MDQMLISDERLVMVVGGREKQSEDGREMWEEHSDEKIRVERCCIKDIDSGTNIRTNLRCVKTRIIV